MLTQYNTEEPIQNKYLLNEFVLGTEAEKLNSDIEGIFFIQVDPKQGRAATKT